MTSWQVGSKASSQPLLQGIAGWMTQGGLIKVDYQFSLC